MMNKKFDIFGSIWITSKLKPVFTYCNWKRSSNLNMNEEKKMKNLLLLCQSSRCSNENQVWMVSYSNHFFSIFQTQKHMCSNIYRNSLNVPTKILHHLMRCIDHSTDSIFWCVQKTLQRKIYTGYNILVESAKWKTIQQMHLEYLRTAFCWNREESLIRLDGRRAKPLTISRKL